MSKKHYELVAAAIRREWLAEIHQGERRAAVENVAIAIADALALDNPKFDKARFLRASFGYV